MRELPFKMIIETEMEQYRHDTFWTKEPETIAWIDSFKPGETLLDIGANIGMYSLYAASRGNFVFAIEPMPSNYVRLIENAKLNNFDTPAFCSGVCLNIAFGNKTDLYRLFIPNSEIGQSGSQIRDSIDEHGNIFKYENIITVLGFTVDDFLKQFVVNFYLPDHIKIDVDGHEADIIEGMKKTIKNRVFKSMLIECNLDRIDVNALDVTMSKAGYTKDNPFNKLENHSRNRRGGNPENIVYVREGE